jgi:molybdopterin-containing oxidoreductase family iron-sulfur binding subunit
VENFAKNPEFALSMGIDSHIPPNISLYHNPPLTAPHQWGMTIDLNLCTGCSACTVACQAENNIPIVGREQVINGREMHWIRIDRYFASMETSSPNPEMVMQPVPCMHCENAPCETVCPVNATVHNEEGLNVMTYNRCIGTRYCANNCPFKVRRFNYFDFNKRRVGNVKLAGVDVGNLYLGPLGLQNDDKIAEMQKNPNVTVRMRGVIEKCSFCVQRLEEAKIAHKVKTKGTDQVKLPTDTVKSACMQVCPTGAIAFGDISDPESKVAKAKADPRNYSLLMYLNILPRVTYLARLKNPNPAMPDATHVGEFNVGGKHHGEHGSHGDAGDHGKEGTHGHGEGAKPESAIPQHPTTDSHH